MIVYEIQDAKFWTFFKKKNKANLLCIICYPLQEPEREVHRTSGYVHLIFFKKRSISETLHLEIIDCIINSYNSFIDFVNVSQRLLKKLYKIYELFEVFQ